MSLLPTITLLMFSQVGGDVAYMMWHLGFFMSALVFAVCIFGGACLGCDFVTSLITRSYFDGTRHFGYLAATLTAVIVGVLVSIAIESFATRSIPLRAKPLISALEAYESKYEKPPETLQRLVPEFIGAIPHTGMPGFPNYEYRPLKSPERSRWELGVQCPSVYLFKPEWRVYRPLKNTGERNVPMRFSDWISLRK